MYGLLTFVQQHKRVICTLTELLLILPAKLEFFTTLCKNAFSAFLVHLLLCGVAVSTSNGKAILKN